MPQFGVRAVGLHRVTHQDGGDDEISVAALSGELADDQPTTWDKVSGKPSTFPPDLHAGDHQNTGSDEIVVAGLSGELVDDQPTTWDKVSSKPKLWQVVAQGSLDVAATTITISGLDGDSHEFYRLLICIPNGSGVLCAYYVAPNGITDTVTNVFWETWSTGMARRNDTHPPFGLSWWNANESGLCDLILNAKTGGNRHGVVTVARSYPVATIGSSTWVDTTTNITSLVITAEQANGLGIGTYYTLFGLV